MRTKRRRGAATTVVEDVGGIARTTQTLNYESSGRAIEVQDASGKQFHTNYDADGQIQSVYRTDGGSQMIAEYTYGSTPWVSGDPIVDYGQPTSVTDGLSGVTRDITYTTTGAGIGQPAAVSETNGSDSYIVSYTYNELGDRATSTYETPNGTAKWGYSDYVSVGMSNNPSRVFQTLTKLDGGGNPTAEEFHYAYDCQGRLRQAAFAQTPQNTSAPYYSNEPLSRARASYSYDAGGRLTGIYHYWDTASGSQAVLANECDYSPVLALKTASRFYSQDAGNPSQFQLDRTETYGYDANLDYLTSANYNDGLPNANPTWSYDAAGNRNDSVCDNLNRATQIGGVTCTNDILGNRLTKGTTSYTWDALNRMTGVGSTSSYVYRADGMRVSKTVGEATTRYRYDGQMGMQDVDSAGVVMNYGLGARGIDYMARTSGTTTAVGFPVYDGHGNMVATLARSSGNTFTLGNQRSFDAWGSVHSGSGGDPTARYCANLGHKQDDESGLIYMRARYYEPTSGRFVSEDPARNGANWFSYCSGRPLNNADRTGKADGPDSWTANDVEAAYMVAIFLVYAAVIVLIMALVATICGLLPVAGVLAFLGLAGLGAALVWFGIAKLMEMGVGSSPAVPPRGVPTNEGVSPDGYKPPVLAGLTGMGEIGLMCAGVLLGWQPGDADASVWGLW